MPALYLALTIEGMFLEVGHGFAHRLDPLTICSYSVDVDNVADLRTDAGRRREGVNLAAMGCAWLYDRASGRRPASWDIACDLSASGAAGLLTPSFARGASPGIANLVLWRWGPALPQQVIVYDPSHRLPRDQSSWPT